MSADSSGNGTSTVFFVFSGNATKLLGRDTAVSLSLLQLGPGAAGVNGVGVGDSVGSGAQFYQKKYPQCFGVVGKLKDFKVSLHIDPSEPPID